MSIKRRPSSDEVPTKFSGPLAVCLLVVITLHHTGFPLPLSYLAVSVVYISIGIIFVYFSDPILAGIHRYVSLFFLLVGIATISTVVNLSMDSIIRLGAFVLFTTANFFIVPRVIPLRFLSYYTSRFTVVFILLGLSPYIGTPGNIWFLDISTWGVDVYWHSEVEVITSIFNNPNTLGFFALVGAVFAFGEWLSNRSSSSLLAFAIATFGLALTNYRSGWIAFLVAFTLAGMYQWGGRRTLVASLIGGLAFTLVVMLLLFGVIPGPTSLTEVSLNGRRLLWTAGVHATFTKPFFGHSMAYGGTHNSFIRMFAAFGIVGGTAYLLLVLTTTIESARAVSSERELMVVMALAGFLFIQLFAGFSFIGISLRSTLVALLMGYYITGAVYLREVLTEPNAEIRPAVTD